MFTKMSKGFVLRKFGKRFDAADRFGMVAPNNASSVASANGFSLVGLLAVVLVIAALAVAVFHPASLHLASGMTALGFAGIVETPKAPAKIREMQANLKALVKELEVGQQEMIAGPISQTRGEELEEKAREMEELQGHLDKYNKIAGILKGAKEVRDVMLPQTEENISRKRLYTTPGHLFITAQDFKTFRAAHPMSGWSGNVKVGNRLGKKVLLTGKDAVDFETKAFNSADLPSLGTDSIIPYDRDPELVRFEEPEILTIRDILNVVPTTSDTVKYVKYTTTQRGAGSQAAPGDLKAFLRLSTELKSVSVETIAVLSKITEQDIDDAPRLVGLINGEMSLDVKVEEERQLTWGDGTNGTLNGLFSSDASIPEFARSEAGDTIIDTIRKMRTDLRKARVTPNFVAIDPIDWEGVELAKGSTNYYIWGLVSDMRGPRIWSLPVIESDAMTNPETGERRVLMGDGKRGATIYDRAQLQLAVGFMDDDFGRNLRTLRCEERVALAVKRNFAFEFFQTEEPNS